MRFTFQASASEMMYISPSLVACQTGVATAVPSLRYVVRLTYLLRAISSGTAMDQR
jgi:hypothetical protein